MPWCSAGRTVGRSAAGRHRHGAAGRGAVHGDSINQLSIS